MELAAPLSVWCINPSNAVGLSVYQISSHLDQYDPQDSCAAKIASSSWMLIWDTLEIGIEKADSFPNIQDFIPQSEFGAIWVMSKHQDSSALVIEQSNRFIELFGLDESDVVGLLIQQSQIKEGIAADAKKIVERLGFHLLALTQAGAYIRKCKLRLSEFMNDYKR